MKNSLKNTFKTLALGIVLAASIHPAQALSAHTWLSGVLISNGVMGTTGQAAVDTGTCDRLNPCATISYALSQTSAGGTISAVNAGDYGPVTINKSVTIDGTGTLATISGAANTSAITINEATATDTVILRHLSLNGLGTATSTGISVSSGNVVVDDCKLTGFTTADIDFPTTSGTEIVQNTTISNSPLAVGIRVGTVQMVVAAVKPFASTQAPPPLLVSIKDVTVQNAQVAVQGLSGMTDIKDSLLTQNTATAVSAKLSGATISVSGCVLSGNTTTAVASVAGAIVRLTNNDIFNNGGAINNTGTVSTTGNNRRAGNTSAGANATTDKPNIGITQQ